MTTELFLNQSYQHLDYPWLKQRLTVNSLPRALRSVVFGVLGRKDTADSVHPLVDKKRITCEICPSEKQRMTTNYCSKCHAAFCAEL